MGSRHSPSLTFMLKPAKFSLSTSLRAQRREPLRRGAVRRGPVPWCVLHEET